MVKSCYRTLLVAGVLLFALFSAGATAHSQGSQVTEGSGGGCTAACWEDLEPGTEAYCDAVVGCVRRRIPCAPVDGCDSDGAPTCRRGDDVDVVVAVERSSAREYVARAAEIAARVSKTAVARSPFPVREAPDCGVRVAWAVFGGGDAFRVVVDFVSSLSRLEDAAADLRSAATVPDNGPAGSRYGSAPAELAAIRESLVQVRPVLQWRPGAAKRLLVVGSPSDPGLAPAAGLLARGHPVWQLSGDLHIPRIESAALAALFYGDLEVAAFVDPTSAEAVSLFGLPAADAAAARREPFVAGAVRRALEAEGFTRTLQYGLLSRGRRLRLFDAQVLARDGPDSSLADALFDFPTRGFCNRCLDVVGPGPADSSSCPPVVARRCPAEEVCVPDSGRCVPVRLWAGRDSLLLAAKDSGFVTEPVDRPLGRLGDGTWQLRADGDREVSVGGGALESAGLLNESLPRESAAAAAASAPARCADGRFAPRFGSLVRPWTGRGAAGASAAASASEDSRPLPDVLLQDCPTIQSGDGLDDLFAPRAIAIGVPSVVTESRVGGWAALGEWGSEAGLATALQGASDAGELRRRDGGSVPDGDGVLDGVATDRAVLALFDLGAAAAVSSDGAKDPSECADARADYRTVRLTPSELAAAVRRGPGAGTERLWAALPMGQRLRAAVFPDHYLFAHPKDQAAARVHLVLSSPGLRHHLRTTQDRVFEAQVAGTRVVTLFPPSAVWDVYPFPEWHPLRGYSQAPWPGVVDGVTGDDDDAGAAGGIGIGSVGWSAAFPRYARLLRSGAGFRATVRPGQVLHIPPMWWYADEVVEGAGPSVVVAALNNPRVGDVRLAVYGLQLHFKRTRSHRVARLYSLRLFLDMMLRRVAGDPDVDVEVVSFFRRWYESRYAALVESGGVALSSTVAALCPRGMRLPATRTGSATAQFEAGVVAGHLEKLPLDEAMGLVLAYAEDLATEVLGWSHVPAFVRLCMDDAGARGPFYTPENEFGAALPVSLDSDVWVA